MRIPTLGALTLAAAATVVALPTAANAAAPTAVPDTAQASFETAKVINVLANDANPFPGKPLTVVRASVGSGGGDARVDGDRVVVTPATGFHGQLTGSYRPAIVALVVFFVAGFVLLRRVDVRRGILDAGNELPHVV